MPRLFRGEHRMTTLLALGIALVALVGGRLANRFDGTWYRDLIRPDFLPAWLERSIPWIWTVLFFLAGLGLAELFASPISSQRKNWLYGLLTLQLLLNYSYSYVFTVQKDINLAFWIAMALATIVALLIVSSWRRVRLLALCFMPYLAWVCFATYLTGWLADLNPPGR